MDIKVTEFELKFSAALVNLGHILSTYSDDVNRQLQESKMVIDTLRAENKKLTEQLEPKEGEKMMAVPKKEKTDV